MQEKNICKHKFEPRYDVHYPKSLLDVLNKTKSMAGYLKDHFDMEKTYIHDICVKCGLKITRE